MPGFSLLECVLSLGLLACAVPVVLAAFGQAGQCHASSMHEARAVQVVPLCLRELQAARLGHGMGFDADAVWCEDGVMLAVGADGNLLRRISPEMGRHGVREIDGRPVAALVRLTGKRSEANAASVVRIAVETPAAAPANRRDHCTFNTLLR